jgi:release factor glutamine methyltransferase
MASVAARLAVARATLEAAGLDPAEAALDAEVLARYALGWDRATLLTRAREPEPPGFEQTFSTHIARRAQREPVALIVGHREFWGLDFEVTSDVLIPRPETELVVEEGLACIRNRAITRAIDVGTGSGCLAVALAVEVPALRVLAIDRSEDAIAIAARNAATHGVSDRVTFRQGDVLDGVTTPAELIVSNPPYVPDGDALGMQPEVVRYEPHAALFAGPDGLDVINRLLRQGADHLTESGVLILEFGFGQADAVVKSAEQLGWRVLGVREDLQGIPRVIVLDRDLT